MSFKSWLSSLTQPRRRPIRKATRRRTLLSVEHLEDRVVPTGNLLLDGGFKMGTNAPGTYSVLANYGPWISHPAGPGGTAILGMPFAGMPALEGVEAMHIGFNRLAGSVSQTFPTTIGTQYNVSLSVIGWLGETGQVTATLTDGTTTDLVANFNAPGGNVWGSGVATFTATGTQTTIEVKNVPSGACTIDNVQVVQNDLPLAAVALTAPTGAGTPTFSATLTGLTNPLDLAVDGSANPMSLIAVARR